MTFYGADTSQLRELAKAVDTAATLLSSRASSLQGQIQSAPWRGADGARFRQDWNGSYRPSLERVVSSLRHNSKLLLQHADEQEKASDQSGGGGSTSILGKFVDLGNKGLSWLEGMAQQAAAAEAHREELAQSVKDNLKATPEEQAKWWAGLSEEDRQYLIEGEGEDGPFADDLMDMDGGIPEAAQDQAKQHLRGLISEDTPVLTETSKATLDLRVAWAHGDAGVGTKLVENADGSATLKVHGNLGLGVNDPTGTAGVTLSGEASREYEFGSVEEAMAAREQMYSDLPPDSAGEVKDALGNTPGYIMDTVNDAAKDNGSTGQDDKLKGTLSFKAEGEGGPASGSAQLDLAYERNMTDGSATASAEVSAQGKLNLDGQVFEASGKGGVEMSFDKDSNLDKVSLSMDGTVATGVSVGPEIKPYTLESDVTVGTQSSVKIEVDYNTENKPLVDSYMRNVALGNDAGAAADAAKLYEAGSATVQVNSVATASNTAGFSSKVVDVEFKTENQATTNVTTYVKVANDTKLERL